MSCVRLRLTKTAMAVALVCGLFACFGWMGVSSAQAANSISVTKAATPESAGKASPWNDGGYSYSYTKMIKARDSKSNSPLTYHVGDLYCTTKSSVSFKSLFPFASASDKVIIKGTYIDTDTKKAADAIDDGSLNKVAMQSVTAANGGEPIETTFGELTKKDARIALYYAASAKTSKQDAENENTATLKKKNSVNMEYAPALFVPKNVSDVDQSRILKVTSITFVDSGYSGNYATVSIDSCTYTGAKAKPKATLTYCGKSLSATALSADIKAGSAKATVTAEVNGHKVSKTGSFAIKPASLDSASLSYSSTTYSGSSKTPSAKSVYAKGIKSALSSSDYSVSYSNNLNAGTAKATITGKGNYTGTLTRTFKINKAKQNFTVDTSIKKESWRSTQAGNHGTAKFAVKGAQGKVTFTKVGGSSRLKVNGATSQRLMVKRGTAKGVYSAKIRVTAGETSNYAATSKVVTLKIRLK